MVEITIMQLNVVQTDVSRGAQRCTGNYTCGAFSENSLPRTRHVGTITGFIRFHWRSLSRPERERLYQPLFYAHWLPNQMLTSFSEHTLF